MTRKDELREKAKRLVDWYAKRPITEALKQRLVSELVAVFEALDEKVANGDRHQ